jgi:hypothetical protein
MLDYIVLAAIFFVFLLLMLAVVSPRTLVLFIWPVLMCYPHQLTLGMMPLNMGFDDFYIILVFIVIVFRFGLGRFNFPVKAGLGFYLVFLMADLTGLITVPDPTLAIIVFKTSLKGVIYLLFTWIMATTLKTEKDLRYHMFSFLLSMAAASLIALADYFDISVAQWFYILNPDYTHYRAAGSFMSSDSVGINLVLPFFVAFSLSILQGRAALRLLSIILCIIYIDAQVLSISRSGWVGMIVGMMAMSMVAKRKHIAILAAGVVFAGFILFFGAYWSGIWQSTVQRTFTEHGFESHGRFELWLTILKNPYPALLLFGRGWHANLLYFKGTVTPHCLYFDITYLLGLGGTILFVFLFTRYFRTSNWLRENDPDPFFQMCGQGLWLGMIAVLGTGITADPFWEGFSRYGLFFWLSWLWARQEILAYDDYLVPYPPKEWIYASDSDHYEQMYETYPDQDFE